MSYLTNELLSDWIVTLKQDRDEIGEFKKSGSGRIYYGIDRTRYIIATYQIYICELLQKLIKKGNYSSNRVAEHLRNMDWEYYSFSSKAYCGMELYELFGEKKSKSITQLLSLQAHYLEIAANEIADILED